MEVNHRAAENPEISKYGKPLHLSHSRRGPRPQRGREGCFRRAIAVIDERDGEARLLALFPADRTPPAGEVDTLQVRPELRVKLLPSEGELYVLAESGARTDKERGMRRRQLKTYWKRLEELKRQAPPRDSLLKKLGVAQDRAGRIVCACPPPTAANCSSSDIPSPAPTSPSCSNTSRSRSQPSLRPRSVTPRPNRPRSPDLCENRTMDQWVVLFARSSSGSRV